MAKSFTTVISIEPKENTIRFVSSQGGDTRNCNVEVRPYKAKQFSEDFFKIFSQYLQEYSQANPSFVGKASSVTIVLPSSVVLMDTVSIPTVKRHMMDNTIKVTLEGKYKTLPELKLNRYEVLANKQYATYGVSAVKSKIIQELYAACSENNMIANIVTYNGSTLVNGAIAANQKLKSETFVLADVKQESTKLSYVINGMCMGSTDLPFGYKLLENKKVVAENMLFDHSIAELAVLNAKEKAKAKALTMMGGASSEEDAIDEEELSPFEAAFAAPAQTSVGEPVSYKTLPKKTPRILPKFMQRPEPANDEDTKYENFRYFEKYILEFIKINKRLTQIQAPKTVLLNIPAEFEFLLERTNLNENENGAHFAVLDLSREGDFAKEHLDLYGALFVDNYNRQNNF